MLLTNKIYEGNLFMRYSKHLTYAERMFLRARLNRVRHITLDPDGPGVVRIHLVPCHKPDRETPFTAILNGQDILPPRNLCAPRLGSSRLMSRPSGSNAS